MRLTEEDMRRALFPTMVKAAPMTLTPGLTVVMHVSNPHIDNKTHRLEYTSSTISRIDAEIKARRAAQEAGWRDIKIIGVKREKPRDAAKA